MNPQSTTCLCQRCGSDIEFDRATFQLSHQSRTVSFGQTVACPHCGLQTTLTQARPNPGAGAAPIVLYILAAGLILLGRHPTYFCTGLILIAIGLLLNFRP